MSDPYVPDPTALRGETLSTLAAAYEQHRSALVRAEHGIGERESAGRLRSTALDALACSAAAVEHLIGDRTTTIMDALRYGASLDDIATATGFDVDEVIAGSRSWLSRLAEHAVLSLDDVDEMAGFLDRAEAQAVAAADERVEQLRRGGTGGGGHLDRLIAALTADVRDGETDEVQP